MNNFNYSNLNSIPRAMCPILKTLSNPRIFLELHFLKRVMRLTLVWFSAHQALNLCKMRCEISHIIDSRMRNKFITFSIWSIDMQLHTLKFAPFQELSNHVWHYRGINMRNLTKRLICLEKQAFLGKKWSSENRKAHFEVEFPPHNPTFPLNGWHYRITLVLSFPMALAI